MTRRKTTGSIARGLLALALAAGTTGAVQAQDVKIGVIGPMTGPAANTGAAHREGMELAVKEWNAGEGDYVTENPPQVELVIEDSNSKPEVAISAAQRLMTRDGVDMIIGDTLHSHVTLALMEMAPQYGVPILSAEPVSSAIADKVLSDPERYALYYKGNYNSDGYGKAVHGFYRWAFENNIVPEGGKTIAFVVEDTDYGIANAEKIGELFEADGWTVAATETTPTGTTDFYPQLSKLRELDPDVLVSVFTLANSGIAFVRQLEEQALETSHMAIFYPTRPEFMEQAPEIADGMFWAALQFSPQITPAHQAFSDKIEAEYGSPANYSHAQAYCVMVIALRAIDAAGGTEPAAVAENIGTTDYDCIVGKFVFGEDHTVRSGPDAIPVPVAQVQGETSQIVWPENVATAEPNSRLTHLSSAACAVGGSRMGAVSMAGRMDERGETAGRGVSETLIRTPPARSHKRSSIVAGEIRSLIITQRLGPGDGLPIEKDMIAAYGVSRATIREALKELEVQGLVQMRTGPKGGPVVAGSGAQEAIQAIQNFCYFEAATIQDIYELRTMMEVQVVRSVIGHVDDATFAELEDLVRISAGPARDGGSRSRQRKAEFAFHTVLAACSPNPLFKLMVEVLAGILVSATARDSARHEMHRAWSEENCGFHTDIIRAIRQGHEDEAAALMRQHMESAHRHLQMIYGNLTLEDIALNPRDRS